MIESWVGLEATFALFLRTAWCAAILLLLVWSIQKLAGRWLSPRARYALWLLVVARLVILWTPASSLSLVGQLENRVASAFGSQSPSPPQNDFDASLTSDAEPVEIAWVTEALPPSADLAPPLRVTPVPTWQWSDLPLWSIIAAIWLLGVILFSIRLGRDFWRLRSALRSMTPVSETRVLQLVRRIEQELRLVGIVESSRNPSPLHRVPVGERARVRGPFQRCLAFNKPVRVLVSQEIASPAVTGVFRPTLLLPAIFIEKLSDKELEHVIRHELTHVKRRDVLVNWLLAGIGAVYWFFPLMRYLLSQLRKTRELACDAAVLHRASTQERKAYGKTLLKIMEMVSEADRPALTFTVGVAGMVWNIGNFRKESKMMRERLELVVRDRSTRGRAGWLVAAMALVLIAVGFTEAQENKPAVEEEEITKLTGAGSSNPSGAKKAVNVEGYREIEALSGDLVEKEYNLTQAIASFEHPKRPDTKVAKESLEAWLGRVVKDSGWNGGAEPTISWSGNVAKIRQTRSGHERLQRAIAAQRTLTQQFVFELSVGSLSAEDFQKLDLRDYRNPRPFIKPPHRSGALTMNGGTQTTSRKVPSSTYALSPEQKAQLQKALFGLPSYTKLASPDICTSSSVTARFANGANRPFVTGFDRIAENTDQPNVDVYYDGFEAEQQAIALGDNKVWVRLCCRQSEVTGVTTEKPPGATQEIQSPTIIETSQAAAQEMNLGETLAIFGKTSGKEKGKEEVMVVFATVRNIQSPPDAPRDVSQSEHSALEHTGENPPTANTQLHLPAMRTEVIDVSRTPGFRSFAKLTDQDDEIRAKLLGPAYQQLEVLVTETIDPESPKVLKRNMENLTLEVTASQEVLEKVGDLIRHLVRLAEEGGAKSEERALEQSQRGPARRPPGSRMIYRGRGIAAVVPAKSTKIVTCTYDVAQLPFIDKLYDHVETNGEPTKEQLDAAYGVLRSYLKITVPAFALVEQKKGVALKADYDNLTIEVMASEDDQELVATTLRRLAQLSQENLDDAALSTHRHEVLVDALALETTERSDLNEVRKGVEFVPPKFGKPRYNEQEKPKTRDTSVGNKDKSKGATITYDVSDFCAVCTPKSKGGKQADDVDCGNPLVHVFVLLSRVLPDVEPGKDSNELLPFLREKKLIVSASLETQEKIAEVINYMNKLSVEDAKRLIEGNNLTDAIREQEIYFALKQPVEVKVRDKPLADVLRFFGETTKINIVPDAAGFVEEGVQWNEPVSLELKKPITLKSALQLILDPLNLDYVVKNESLLITSKRLTKGQPTTVAYDVAGLPFFAGLLEDLKANREPDQAKEVAAFEKLQTLVKTIPEFAEGKEGFEMQPFYTNLTLVVSAPKETQAQVAILLKQIERQSLADLEKSIQELKRR